jgi:hypothetical protein
VTKGDLLDECREAPRQPGRELVSLLLGETGVVRAKQKVVVASATLLIPYLSRTTSKIEG